MDNIMEKVKVGRYKNGFKFKLKNRRVCVKKLENGDYGLRFDILTKDKGDTCICTHRNDKVMTTSIVLSKQAMDCLMIAMIAMLEENGENVIDECKSKKPNDSDHCSDWKEGICTNKMVGCRFCEFDKEGHLPQAELACAFYNKGH